MKPPDGPRASGERTVAGALMAALRLAGHEVTLASRLSGHLREPEDLPGYAAAARAERARLAADASWRQGPRPDLWLTYHLYYRCPDLLGPAMAAEAGIPYVVVQASHAAKRAQDDWALALAAAEHALAAARLVFATTLRDRAGLEAVVPAARLHDLPPFLEAAPFRALRAGRAEARARLGLAPGAAPLLLAVGMMRDRRKRESYRALAAALALLADRPWELLVAGDGPARAEIESALGGFGGRVRFLGERPPEAMPALYAAADLLVWPGLGEAYGMVYLEAAAAGCPSLAMANAGVAASLADGVSGLVTPERDIPAYAQALTRLLDDAQQRRALGARAAAWIDGARDLPHAAARLARAFAAAGLA